jgi:replication factor C small subunit
MKIVNEKFNIWEEKYRPQCIDDIILPEEYKKQFKEYIKENMLPNMLLVSSVPGLGKTTVCKCIIKETQPSIKWINASQDNNVSTIRNEIVGFASTISAEGKKKLIILDEADNLTTSSSGSAGAQDILRGVIEQFSNNTRFILTANYKDRFITPLLSRLKIYDFDEIFMTHKKELAKEMYKRLIFICENEGVEYQKEDLQEIIKINYPSVRNMTVMLQQNIFDNKLVLKNKKVETIFTDILDATLKKDFNEMRKLTLEASNPSSFYTWFWKMPFENLPAKIKPEITLKLAQYQELDRNARNKSITLAAFLTEIMAKV